MKLVGKIKKVHIIVMLIFVFYSIILFNVASMVAAGDAAEPGSPENPLVAQDYVDEKVAELTSKVAELTSIIEDLKSQNEDLKNQLAEQLKTQKFEAIEVKAGKRLIAGGSAEIVLRSGRATAITSPNGGLSDLIAGTDIPAEASVPLNHLILIPRDDGRGLKAQTDVWVLVKGTYRIE